MMDAEDGTKIKVWIDPDLQPLTEKRPDKNQEMEPEDFFQAMFDILGDD